MEKVKNMTGIKAIYDSGKGKFFDRYTIYFRPQLKKIYPHLKHREQGKMYEFLACSEYPFHPQGFGQHGEGRLGPHNGKRISFYRLPEDVQKAVKQDLKI